MTGPIYPDRDMQVVAMSENMNNSDIGRRLGLTRERVRQILLRYNIVNTPDRRIDFVEHFFGKYPDVHIAAWAGVSPSVVYEYRIARGIPVYERPIGNCPNCKKNPYARNLCLSCYTRAKYKGILDQFPTIRKLNDAS